MNCPNCNAPVSGYERFCENCGSILSQKPQGAETNAGGTVQAPASPYESPESIGKHAAPASQSQAYVPTAQAVATAFAESAAAANTSFASSSDSGSSDPYAAAVNEASQTGYQASSSYANPAQSTYAQPSYSEPSYAQPTYAPVPPSPYANPNFFDPKNPTGAPKASAAGFGLAIASLVIGCLGLLTFGVLGFLCFLGVIFAIIALVLRSGYQKRGEYDSHAGATLGMSIAGIITNVLSILIFIALVAVIAVAADTDSTYYDFDDPTAIEEILGEDV